MGAGVAWIGLLYYFNFVQVPSIAQANADEGGPGPAAITKYVAPRALLWFRWAALVTWLTGATYLYLNGVLGDAFELGMRTGNALCHYDWYWCMDGNHNAIQCLGFDMAKSEKSSRNRGSNC